MDYESADQHTRSPLRTTSRLFCCHREMGAGTCYMVSFELEKVHRTSLDQKSNLLAGLSFSGYIYTIFTGRTNTLLGHQC